MKADVPKEPALNVPWPVASLAVVLILAHAARTLLGIPADSFALTSAGMSGGAIMPLFTYVFVHGGWPHVLMNSVFILAFGAPVSRWLGTNPRGAVAFWVFFLACGVASGAGYAGIHDALVRFGAVDRPWVLVGASGAASGLMGAAARLIEGQGRLGAVGGRRVVTMGAGWIVANIILGVSGMTPGTAGAAVAWEAHIVGFFAGVLLAGVGGRLAGPREDHSIAP